jgi:antitoxin component HigA of HigAB toxin-antitoxin module
MAATTKKRVASDTYFELVRAFPLRRLKNHGEHLRAKDIVLRLSRGKADVGARDYLDVLVGLIADFETRSEQTLDVSDVSAAQLVRHRLEERRMSVSQLAREIGIPQPNLSEMLSGSRDWSKAAIRSLSKLFNIRAERFLA